MRTTLLAKPAVTSRPVHPLIRDRWSPRAFEDRPVSHDDLVALFEAARWSASASNGQPWRWLVATREDAARYETLLSGLNPRNQRWARQAPVLLFVLAQTAMADGRPNTHAWYDAGQAMAQLTLEATARGLVLHQMGGIERSLVRERCAVPDGFDVVVGVALGYQGHADTLPEELPERERASRTRLPISDLVFGDRFGITSPIVDVAASTSRP